jgi:hypothetical protein
MAAGEADAPGSSLQGIATSLTQLTGLADQPGLRKAGERWPLR